MILVHLEEHLIKLQLLKIIFSVGVKKLINTRSVKNPNTSRPLDQHYQKNSLKHKTDLNTRAGFANFTLPFGFTLVFFYEATFQIDGRVKRHNVQIWGAQHPHQISKMKEIHQKST